MASPSVNIPVQSNTAGLRSDMQEAASVVRSATDQMSQAGRQAMNAWSQLASTTLEANAAHKAVKDTLRAIATGEVPMTTRVVNDLAVAQAEAAQAAQAHAAAQRELKTAMGGSTTAMASGFSQATLLSNVLGLRLGRGMEQIISRTPALSSALGAVFPVVTAVAFLQLAEHIGEAISKWIANTFIFTKAMQAAYDAEVAYNNHLNDVDKQTKQHKQELFNATHTHAQAIAEDLKNEKKHVEELTKIYAQKTAETIQAGKKELQERARPAMIETSEGPVDSGSAAGEATDKTVAATKAVATAAETAKHELEDANARVLVLAHNYQYAAQEEAAQSKRKADQAARAAEAAQEQAEKLARLKLQLGNNIPGLNTDSLVKMPKGAALEDLEHILQAVKHNHKELEHEEEQAQKKKAESDWKVLEAAKKAANELREVNDIKAKTTRDEGLGNVDYKETQVKGQQSLGMIDDGQALSKLRALNAEKLAIERTYIAQKMEFDKLDEKALLKDKDEETKILAKGRKQALQDDIANLQQRMQAYRQWMTQVSQSMFTGINSWAQHQKTFTQGMKQEWNSIAMDTIRAIERVAEQWILTHVLMKAAAALFHAFDIGGHLTAAAAKLGIDAAGLTASKTAQGTAALTTSQLNMLTAASYAAVAAAATMASISAIPVVGPPAAPAAAATMYSAAMVWAGMAEFSIGGVVPKTEIAMVHGGERVLTQQQNTTLERIANQTTNNDGGGGVQLHVHQQNQGLDGPSMGRVMRRNSKAMAKELQRAVRMGKLGGF